jgi:hypothetical protein
MNLPRKRPRSDGLHLARQGDGGPGRDVKRRLALRTEAAVLPSALGQADDPDGVPGGVDELSDQFNSSVGVRFWDRNF